MPIYEIKVKDYQDAKLAIQRELLILELAEKAKENISQILWYVNMHIAHDGSKRLIEELELEKLQFGAD